MIPGLIVEWLLANQVSSKSKKLHDQKQQHHISLSLLLASDWLLMLLMMVCVFGRWRSLVVGCACISPYVDPALAMEICICIIGRLLFLSNLFEILLITNSNINVFNVLVFLLQPASAQKRLSASVARRLSASVVIADGAVVLAGNRVERGAPAELPSPNLFAAARGGGMPEKSGQMIKQNDHYLVS